MRRIVIALMTTVSGLALLFSYHTSTNQSAVAAPGTGAGAGTSGAAGTSGSGSTSGSGGASGTGSTSGSSGAGSGSGASSAGAAAAAGGSSGTFTGDPVDTRWGVVQVKITVANGKITAADAVQVPSGNGRDAEINNYAVPILDQTVISAQSASFDGVSGATVTSDGYKQSLQSALDQAHL